MLYLLPGRTVGLFERKGVLVHALKGADDRSARICPVWISAVWRDPSQLHDHMHASINKSLPHRHHLHLKTERCNYRTFECQHGRSEGLGFRADPRVEELNQDPNFFDESVLLLQAGN